MKNKTEVENKRLHRCCQQCGSAEWRWRLLWDSGGVLTLEVTERLQCGCVEYRYVREYGDVTAAAQDVMVLRRDGPQSALGWDGNLLNQMDAAEEYQSPSRYAGGWGVLDAVDDDCDDLSSCDGGALGDDYRAAIAKAQGEIK